MAAGATKRLQLGRELKKARNAADMTQARAAAALGCKQPKINKIETTTCVISAKDLNGMLRIYEPDEETAERIRQLAAESGPGASAGTPPNRDYLKMLADERAATEILSLHAERIPNLLQSEHYTLMQYARADNPTPAAAIMTARREREKLFTIAHPPRYQALFSVSALYRMPGGRSAEVVIDQAQHMLTLSEKYPRLTIQIIPWEAGLPYMPSDLTVLRFADPNKKDAACVEYGAGESRTYDGKKQVAAQIKHWTMANEAALSIEDSRKFLHDVIVEARTW